MTSSYESNYDITDITNDISVMIINPEDPGKEANKIRVILNKISDINIDDEFYINNDGVKYKLGNDSKIISKIYELIIIEKLKNLLDAKGFKYIENDIQNKYPDFIIISKTQKEKYYAVDIKSTYIKNKTRINGFTLGTYKGYFKDRKSMRSIVKPYNNFIKHFCVCVIYTRDGIKIPVNHIIVREKWEIARNGTGSGNTCNIGSIKLLSDLLANKPYFSSEDEFNTFWLNYKC
jgi:hypothetical protein